MRRPNRYYSLFRPKLRQSWNKYNLYNIARSVGKEPLVRGRATFFQQKWAAKSKTRGYHGEHIPEKKWVRLFSRRLISAVDMPPEYLAANDGSEQAAGRGSGLSTSNVSAETFSKAPRVSSKERGRVTHFSHRSRGFGDVNELLSRNFKDMTPYMQMTFAPLERRLDTAVFRAMFASSVRQARQFVIHGAVKVNGKKMVHPSYALNPGDMFQVDVEKVLYGTGEQRKKSSVASEKVDIQAAVKRDQGFVEHLRKEQEWKIKQREWSQKKKAGENVEEFDKKAEYESAEWEGDAYEGLSEKRKFRVQDRRLVRLRILARDILQGDLRNLSVRQKKDLHEFRFTIKKFLSLPGNKQLDGRDLVDQMHAEAQSLREKAASLGIATADSAGEEESSKALENAESEISEEQTEMDETQERKERNKRKYQELKAKVLETGLFGLKDPYQISLAKKILSRQDLSRDEMRKMATILRNDLENPIDESKPYLTPWRPRPYMSGFAFIPRYLEVNPNICAAVYLRHPVARKGIAEVPTPFSYLTNQLAHNWYLQRG